MGAVGLRLRLGSMRSEPLRGVSKAPGYAWGWFVCIANELSHMSAGSQRCRILPSGWRDALLTWLAEELGSAVLSAEGLDESSYPLIQWVLLGAAAEAALQVFLTVYNATLWPGASL